MATNTFDHMSDDVIYNPSAEDCKTAVAHAALVIGYGTTNSNEDYWLIQNSYGTEWADGGFGRIVRGPICSEDPHFYSAAFESLQIPPHSNPVDEVLQQGTSSSSKRVQVLPPSPSSIRSNKIAKKRKPNKKNKRGKSKGKRTKTNRKT